MPTSRRYGAPTSGKQTISIPQTATMHRSDQLSTAEKTLTVGNLIHVYNARPQTIIVNGGW